MQFEEQVAREQIVPSFIESLEYGAFSITAPSVLFTFYLVYRMDRHLQHNNFVLSHLEHCFCAHQRILNDIKSADRERREGNAGYVSNLVLLLEKSLSPVSAQEFVMQQAYGYERLIVENIEILGADNPFAQLIKTLFEIVLKIYKSRSTRY
jgi:Terpene synthase family 2, C-terminal metal binding